MASFVSTIDIFVSACMRSILLSCQHNCSMRFLFAPRGCQGLLNAIGISQQLGNGKLLTNGPVCYGNAVLHVDISSPELQT